MSVPLALSRFALVTALIALALTLAATPRGRRPAPRRRRTVMALGTLALGIALFALFFGLVAACDRL